MGRLLTLPYTVELNDIPMMIVQHHESEYLMRRAIDQFDRLYAEGEHRAKIISLRDPSLYHRPAAPDQIPRGDLQHARRFDGVVYWTGEEIVDWYLKSGAVPIR